MENSANKQVGKVLPKGEKIIKHVCLSRKEANELWIKAWEAENYPGSNSYLIKEGLRALLWRHRIGELCRDRGIGDLEKYLQTEKKEEEKR